MFWLRSIHNTGARALAARARPLAGQRGRGTGSAGAPLTFATLLLTIATIAATTAAAATTANNSTIKWQQQLNNVKSAATNTRPLRGRPQERATVLEQTRLVARAAEFAAGNSHERAQPRNLLLLVQESGAPAPDFTEPIGNHTVPVGRDAQLSCKISNLGAYRTAWLRVEDKGILTIHTNVITRNYRFGLLNDDEERNFVLTIKNVQPSDRGGYMCQINSVPMKYAIGYLDVLTPPVFDDKPGGDNSAEYAASATATTAVGAATDGETQQQQHQAGPGGGGSQPPANSSQTTVIEGAGAALTCRASGHPVPSITWRREDGKPILLNGLDLSANDDDHGGAALSEIKDSPSIRFKAASRLNSGAYLCIASNGVQPSASKRLVLDVQFAPVITLPQFGVAAQLGQRQARLECLVELNPLGSYHWIKLATSTTNTDRRPMALNQEDDLWLIEHDELMASDKYDIVIRQINSEKVHMSLLIRQVEKQDFSWYKCIAKNSLGLQSNFIRFYESTVPADTLASSSGSGAASASGPSPAPAPTSSFSFNSLFRSSSQSRQQQQQQPLPDDKLNVPQNDESRQPAPGAAAGQPGARAHSWSSWNQRSTGSSPSSSSSSSSGASSAASSRHAPIATATSNALLMFLLALVITTTASLPSPRLRGGTESLLNHC